MSDCDNLKKGLMAEDVKMVRKALKNELVFYSRENLIKLALTIADRCSVTASNTCFDCIYTYPAQSHLNVSFSQAGITIEKIIDISYTSTNQMKIVNVHD